MTTVAEAVTETIHRSYRHDGSHVPPKAIAQDMNLSPSVLYDIADEHRERKLRAEEIPALVRATGNALILDVLARAVGGAFVPLPVRSGRFSDDVRCSSEALSTFGNAMQAYADALPEGFSEKEAEVIALKGYAAVVRILSLVEHVRAKAQPAKAERSIA